MTSSRLLVRRSDIGECRIAMSDEPTIGTLNHGQVSFKLDRFGFSANNITYVALGDAMHYWDFFPVDAEWGSIPVWGFAGVLASKHDGVAVGDRYFGYWPMASHAVMQPSHASKHGFVDGTPHRAQLPAVYNQYQRTAADPGYDALQEDAYMLLRPLFVTSFMLEDFLQSNRHFGADVILVSSASSKTAYALAYLAALQAKPRPAIVGLTSASNVAFVGALDCYDQVLAYEDVESLDASARVVYADFSGNATLRGRVHRHFGANVVHSATVGMTDWDELAPAHGLPGAKPTLFFAPTQIKLRAAEWGPGGIEQRVTGAWKGFLPSLAQWMTVTHRSGGDAAMQLYRDMLAGRAQPRDGFTVSL